MIRLIAKTNCECEARFIAEVAGECYNRKDKSNKTNEEIIAQLQSFWLKKHYSPFEFVDFDVEISGLSIVALKQLTRHWNSSMMVKSGRYCKEDDPMFYIPQKLIDTPFEARYLGILQECEEFYKHMINSGINAEDARYILPQALRTEMRFKFTLRDFLCSIYPQRHSKKAQHEIRQVVGEIMHIIKERCSYNLRMFLTWYETEGFKTVER